MYSTPPPLQQHIQYTTISTSTVHMQYTTTNATITSLTNTTRSWVHHIRRTAAFTAADTASVQILLLILLKPEPGLAVPSLHSLPRLARETLNRATNLELSQPSPQASHALSHSHTRGFVSSRPISVVPFISKFKVNYKICRIIF